MIGAVLDTGSQRTAISEEAFESIGLKRGDEIQVEGSAGLAKGWESVCKVSLTECDQWMVKVDVLPNLPVHMVIGMDIISTGNLSLTYEQEGYIFRFEQIM